MPGPWWDSKGVKTGGELFPELLRGTSCMSASLLGSKKVVDFGPEEAGKEGCEDCWLLTGRGKHSHLISLAETSSSHPAFLQVPSCFLAL